MDIRRGIPRTDAVLADARLSAAVDRLGPAIVKAALLAACPPAQAAHIVNRAAIGSAASGGGR